MDFILFIIGSVLIFIGSNLLIDNSKLIALSLRISPFVVGLTLVAFGTSLPELVVNVLASINNESEIVLGNIVGSNIANIALVLGFIAFWKVIEFDFEDLKHSLFYLVISTLLTAIFVLNDILSFYSGILLLFLFLIYLIHQYRDMRSSDYIDDHSEDIDFNIKFVFFTILGATLLGFGSEIFINSSIGIAVFLGIPVMAVSLSIVALGTSIPELATSIIAVRKGEMRLLIGNILGSNIFNIILVLGASIAINPIQVYITTLDQSLNVFLPLFFMCFVLLLILYILYSYKETKRIHGLGLLLTYFIFIFCNFYFS